MTGIKAVITVLFLMIFPSTGFAAPYAAIVIDAKTGAVLHAKNEDARLHPAGLTKLATLYEVFSAVENGEIKLDDMVRVSRNAAETSPVNLELREGQRLKVRDLIRATAVMGANDTSTVLAEAISGSEAPFAKRMNKTAQKLEMTRSTFKNPHGLTERGHLSTARDIATLMQALDNDFADFMHIFTRVNTKLSTTRTIQHSGHRLIKDYKEATAVKTGHTRAAGFNGAMMAEKRSDRIIVVVFGGKSTKTRNTQMIKLAELGFKQLHNSE
jgi:D-alanyl-D-alanine carboxypeptidase